MLNSGRKNMLKIWVVLCPLLVLALGQSKYGPEYVNEDSYHAPEESSYYASQNDYHHPRSYESAIEEPRYYQSVESQYPKPEAGGYASHSSYFVGPQQAQSYHSDVAQHAHDKTEPQVPSYDKSEDIAKQREYLAFSRSQESADKPELPSYKRLRDIAYQKATSSGHEGLNEFSGSSGSKDDSSEVPEYSPAPARSASSHPAPVPVDKKLPLYFTMYEKRVIADPVDKYGKGPWRFLTYGHGITYGSKEPGKVFEKGYGYIRALGRDTCKLPAHLCPPKDGKPFEYEGRKEPYFGYRPH